MQVPGAENHQVARPIGGKLVSHGEDRGGRNILGQGQEILQGGARPHAVVDEGSSLTAILASFVEVRGGWWWLQEVEALSKVANSPHIDGVLVGLAVDDALHVVRLRSPELASDVLFSGGRG